MDTQHASQTFNVKMSTVAIIIIIIIIIIIMFRKD